MTAPSTGHSKFLLSRRSHRFSAKSARIWVNLVFLVNLNWPGGDA